MSSNRLSTLDLLMSLSKHRSASSGPNTQRESRGESSSCSGDKQFQKEGSSLSESSSPARRFSRFHNMRKAFSGDQISVRSHSEHVTPLKRGAEFDRGDPMMREEGEDIGLTSEISKETSTMEAATKPVVTTETTVMDGRSPSLDPQPDPFHQWTDAANSDDGGSGRRRRRCTRSQQTSDSPFGDFIPYKNREMLPAVAVQLDSPKTEQTDDNIPILDEDKTAYFKNGKFVSGEQYRGEAPMGVGKSFGMGLMQSANVQPPSYHPGILRNGRVLSEDGATTIDEEEVSIFENKTGLAEDMKFLASIPELCDVTFLVGDKKEPVCAVKAVLGARSKVFHKMLYDPTMKRRDPVHVERSRFRSFLKRSSEPIMSSSSGASTSHQRNSSMDRCTITIEDFDPDVFRQLIEYVHTGCVTLQPRTLLGLLNAADSYALEELKQACQSFVQHCINVDTVCPLLSSADRYVQYKCTKTLLQKVLSFVDKHGYEILRLGSFTLIPKHVVTLILTREQLQADEFTKFQASMLWTKKYCDSHSLDWKPMFIESFVSIFEYHKIPANVLMREVEPLKVVPNDTILMALAYQADPTSVKLPPGVRQIYKSRSMSCQSSTKREDSNLTTSSTSSSDHVHLEARGRERRRTNGRDRRQRNHSENNNNN